MLSYILYFLLAIAIGFLAALFGLGGGFLIVPALTFLGVPIHHAVGTSSAIIIFSSISAVIEYRKHGSIDYKAGLLIALPSIFGAYIGAWTTMVVDESSLKLIFGIVLIMVAMRMIRHDVLIERKLKAWLIPFGGFFAGLASGLLGVGGGNNKCSFSCLCWLGHSFCYCNFKLCHNIHLHSFHSKTLHAWKYRSNMDCDILAWHNNRRPARSKIC